MSKSKQQGPRGERGIPGPPGPPGSVGKRGSVGARGKTGARGSKGSTGLGGARGPTGPMGSPEPATEGKRRIRLLADVDRHINHIYHELEVQMKRTGQIQMELDDLRTKVRNLMDGSV